MVSVPIRRSSVICTLESSKTGLSMEREVSCMQTEITIKENL